MKDLSFTKVPNISAVYIFYDKDNSVLYVGKTIYLRNRLNQHKGYLEGEEWKDEVSRITYIPEDNDCNLELYETYLINTYRAKYNKDKVFKNAPSFKLDIGEEIEITLEKAVFNKRSFYDVARDYALGLISEEEAFEQYPKLKVFVDYLGTERLKPNTYNITKLTKELDNLNRYSTFNIEERIKELFLNGTIKPIMDNFYRHVDIRNALSNLYIQHNISTVAKASIVTKIFKVKLTTRKINGITTNGYYIYFD